MSHEPSAGITSASVREAERDAWAFLPRTSLSTLARGILAGAGLGFIDTTLTYLTGSAPATDVVGIFGIPTALILIAAGALGPFVWKPGMGRAADAALLGLPVLAFGLRGCLFGCDLNLLTAAIRWAPTVLLLGALLLTVFLQRDRLSVGAFAPLALGTQLLAALAFGVRTDEYPAMNLRVISSASALASILLLSSVLLWRRRDLSGRVGLLYLGVLAVASVGIAVALGATPPQLPKGVVPTAQASAAGTPSIVLIVMDTVRPDHLSVYGYRRQTSPHLEQLARQSLVFERATTNATYSLAAHASLLTGLRASQHGAHLIPHSWAVKHPALNLAVGSFAVRGGVSTLAEKLRDRGYATAGLSANDVYLSEWTGLQRGFELFASHAHRRYRFAPIAAPLIVAAQRMGREPFNTQDTWPARAVVNAAIEWIGTAPRPFFMFLNLFDAHEPYTPPGGSPFRGDGLGPDDHEIPEYDAEIRIIDGEIGRLLDYLRSRDLYDGTLVILTADHGQYFGEHGLTGHTHQLYEPVLRVPLLAKLPGQVESRRIEERVGLHEVLGLVVNVVNNETPWRPAGSRPKLIAESWAENREDPVDPNSILPGAVAVYWDDWKLIHRNLGTGDELFNLRSDPDEARNLMIRPSASAVAVAQALARVASQGRQKAGPGAVPELSGEALERLRALGYVN